MKSFNSRGAGKIHPIFKQNKKEVFLFQFPRRG